jgi:hypothetical protein
MLAHSLATNIPISTTPTYNHNKVKEKWQLTPINALLHGPRHRTLDRVFRALQIKHTTFVAGAMRMHGALEGVAFPAEDVVAVLGEAGAVLHHFSKKVIWGREEGEIRTDLRYSTQTAESHLQARGICR